MNMELFLYTLPFALKGWLGVFIVTAAVMLCIILLNKLTGGKK